MGMNSGGLWVVGTLGGDRVGYWLMAMTKLHCIIIWNYQRVKESIIKMIQTNETKGYLKTALFGT